MPSDPDQIEALIAQRRARLTSTIDELAARTKPQAIASRAIADLKAKVNETFRTPDGELRTDRVAAVGGSAVVVLGLMAANRRRRRRRRG